VTEGSQRLNISENVPLAPLTTLGVGGPARFFVEATTDDNLVEAVAWARARGLPIFALGGGSNLVVADSGFAGLVIRIAIRGVNLRRAGDEVVVEAGAGEDWDPLVATCVAGDYAGFECLSGIPGRVGATPIQNVGAYGQEISESFVSLEALDLADARLVHITGSECGFGYRTSRFKSGERDRFIITRVSYRLRTGAPPTVRYEELSRYLSEAGQAKPTLTSVRNAVLTIRRRKAMVLDPAEPDSRSVGSFFVNPVLTADELERVRAIIGAATPAEAMPVFPLVDGRVKVSAAWLIERAGFHRGFGHGSAAISHRHSLAIVNRGGATAAEVVALAEQIKKAVAESFGVSLTPEPVFVGFDRGVGVQL
jgi:UDP-N-acetylmuramate dehydrogenase